MKTDVNFLLVEFVEHASTRAAIDVHRDLTRGLWSLATISSTGAMLGFLGTTLEMIAHMFYSCGGNWASCEAPVGGRLSNALSVGAFGLLVSLLASSFHRYLISRVEKFDLEMMDAQIDLLNNFAIRNS